MNERRARVLDVVTEGYIQSARPVASSIVAEQLGVSSATVRNDYSALEEEGYLRQPHTSAGRIPTMLAYEQYALKFIPPGHLSLPKQSYLNQQLRGKHGEALLQRIADVTAELSGYAVVVSLPEDETLQALEIHLSSVSRTRLLAVIVLENGLIRQLAVDVDPAPEEDVLRDAERSLRQLAVPVSELPRGLSDIASRTEASLTRTLLALAEALTQLGPPRLFSQGLRHLFSEPESADPQFLRSAVERVENPDLKSESDLVILFEEALASVNAHLPFGSSRGGLSIVGPTRMRYKETLMIAHGVSRHVAEQLAETSLN